MLQNIPMFLKVGFSENSHSTNCFCPNYGVLLFMMASCVHGEVFFSVSSISVSSIPIKNHNMLVKHQCPINSPFLKKYYLDI